MKHEYHEGPETWERFQDGMKKLFNAPKPPPEDKKPKAAAKPKVDGKGKG